MFPGHLHFGRVSPLPYSLSTAAAITWLVWDLAGVQPITKPAVVPDRFSETLPFCLIHLCIPSTVVRHSRRYDRFTKPLRIRF